jgi:hypothetical protein
MRAFRIISEITLASIIVTLALASGAQATDQRALAGVTQPPPAQLIVLAEASRHYSDRTARVAERARASEAASTAQRAPAVSWYERKTGQSADSSAAPATTVATPSTLHGQTARNCTATLALQRQRPWCG